jgi:hypothetical protein
MSAQATIPLARALAALPWSRGRIWNMLSQSNGRALPFIERRGRGRALLVHGASAAAWLDEHGWPRCAEKMRRLLATDALDASCQGQS